MTDAKHTPGPWWKDDAYPDDVYRNIIGQDCALVARVGVNGTPGGGAGEADADLIAAAPELLSLLQDAVESFGPHLEGGDDEWLTFAKAAIAKATGGAQ